VLDVARAAWYDPLAEPQIGVDFTKVQTPDEAVEFVQRYGLPNTAYGALGKEDVRGRHGGPVKQLAQASTEILEWAASLRELAHTAIRVRKAAVEHDAKAMNRLRARFKGSDDRSVLLRANAWVTGQLTIGLSESTAVFYSGAPGQFRIGIQPHTLHDVCYFMVARALAEKERLEACEECPRLFIKEDERQRFCSTACGTRARVRRFKARPQSKKRG
jgi:predicted RNA-binding Zn ribbon-like protein